MSLQASCKGVATLEDLADQGVDELEGIEDFNAERAGEADYGCA